MDIQPATYTLDQLCQRVGIGKNTIYRLIQTDALPFRVIRIRGRTIFPIKSVERWLDDEGNINPSPPQPTKRRGRPPKVGGLK